MGDGGGGGTPMAGEVDNLHWSNKKNQNRDRDQDLGSRGMAKDVVPRWRRRRTIFIGVTKKISITDRDLGCGGDSEGGGQSSSAYKKKIKTWIMIYGVGRINPDKEEFDDSNKCVRAEK